MPVVRMILKRGKKILLVKRAEKVGRGLWQFPGGHLDNQPPRKAVLRELTEETGLKVGANQRLKYRGTIRNPYDKRKKTSFYSATDAQPYNRLKLQEEEVSDYTWKSPSDIKKMSKKGKLTQTTTNKIKNITNQYWSAYDRKTKTKKRKLKERKLKKRYGRSYKTRNVRRKGRSISAW